MAKRNKSGRGIEVDFTGVEAGGRVITPGEYVAEVVSGEQKTSSSNNPYIAWTLKIVGDPTFDGARAYYNTSLLKQALWNLRQFLEALGVEVPGGKMSLDLGAYKGLQLGVEIDNEEYNGKPRTRVVDVFPLDEDDDEDDDNEEAEAEATEDDDEEESSEEAAEDDDDEEDDDEDDEEEEAPAPRRRSGKARR